MSSFLSSSPSFVSLLSQDKQQVQQQQQPQDDDTNHDSFLSLTSTPLRRYFSRKRQATIRFRDLPTEPGYIGHYSVWGVMNALIFLSVPIVYIYIGLILLRELCWTFPNSLYACIQRYLPLVASLVHNMDQSSSRLVEAWCVLEGIFYILLKIQIQWLQLKDPLEASLSAAPMMSLQERDVLWSRMMATMNGQASEGATINISDFISGWFFDAPLEAISRYDVLDFLCWSLFEGRNQEHLTGYELEQLEGFLEKLEERLSYHLYGENEEEEEVEEVKEEDKLFSRQEITIHDLRRNSTKQRRPKKVFRFDETSSEDEPNFFSAMYESYNQRYEQARQMLENVHPVQDFCNIVMETEKKTMATASHMYENASVTATNMAANAYDTIIGTGSNMDKQLAALGYATQQQLSELSSMTQQQLVDAWNTVKAMKERLEKAASWSAQTKRIKQQLKGYRMVLSRMRDMSSSVPSKQMAKMMRTITECNETMEKLESRAMDAFFMGTGFLKKSLLSTTTQVPKRYAKYSSDPLLGVSTYPLGFHLFVLAATEVPLRILMKNRGFTRLSMGPVAYYFHPGTSHNEEVVDDGNTPIVFVHGIGIGLIVYLPLIDQLLRSGRPIFCPEIPYVSGFRPWQSPNSILPPAVVCSILTEMLAKHGHWKGAFCGHSYGTTWLSYMCKYAPHAIVAVCFLDPVCFCLHMPRLTKQFVYHRPDPGTVAYMVRTDVIVSWTIQRCFPWARIALFTEQISIPCAVFLSDGDMLVPSATVEQYLRSKGSPCSDFSDATPEHFASSDLTVTIFRGDVHGGWTERSETCPLIGKCVEVLCERAEGKSNRKKI